MIITELDNTFVTADDHFGHTNIIKYCNRPFNSVEEMDAELIARWNSVVSKDDLVYHLGDFTLGDIDVARQYFNLLNGDIYILGNHWHHDKRWLPKGYFGPLAFDYGVLDVVIMPPVVVLELPGLGKNGHPLAITLCHYPLAEWDRKHYGGIHAHGHSHGNYHYPPGELALDVGVDSTDFRPLSLAEVAERMDIR